MKRILVINNYSMVRTLEMAKNGELPFGHCWGVDRLDADKNIQIRFAMFKIPNILYKLHVARFGYYVLQIKYLLMSTGCDAVYTAASPLVDFLAFLKYIGLFKKKLIMIVHHPDNFSLKKKRYDNIVFICKKAYETAIKKNPNYSHIFSYKLWGPDLNFFEKLPKTHNQSSVTFVSNGLSNRDNASLIKAMIGLESKCSILCNQESFPAKCEIPENVKIIYTKGDMHDWKMMSYFDMIMEIMKYSVCVIPIPKGFRALCGLTSLCDAIAVGMPVIMADTTNIGVDISQFGFYYKAGDVEDLREKMQFFIDNPEQIEIMGKAARKFAENNDYDKFSEYIYAHIMD